MSTEAMILKNTLTGEEVNVIADPVDGNVLVQSKQTGLLDVVPITDLHLTRPTPLHDPCPVCGGFDSAHWTGSEPGLDSWSCRCGTDFVIEVEEPR